MSNLKSNYYSPFKQSQQSDRSTDEGFSPLKVPENEILQQKLNEMKISLSNTQQDLELANFKSSKLFQMEEKIDIVLKHNAQLLSENDIITKSLNQKKTESEVWKKKYETQLTSSVQMKAQYELELKKYNNEISRFKDQIGQGQIQNVRTAEEISSRADIDKKSQIQQLKLSYNNDLQIYQEQVRKLRDILEKREQEIGVLNQKIEELKNQANMDSKKLINDKEKIKMSVSQMELDHHKAKEFTRQSIDKQYSTTLENLKDHYNSEMDILIGEINKLKGLLDLKQQEILNLISYNQELKTNFNEDSQMQQIEIQNLKEIINQINEQKDNELHILRERLADHHISDLQGLQFYNDNQQEALTQQITSLRDLLNDKQYEIQKQLSEKQRHKDNYYNEVERLQKELEQQQYKGYISEVEREKCDRTMKYMMQNQIKQSLEFQNQQDQQIKLLEEQTKNLKILIEQKTLDLDQAMNNHKKIRFNLQTDIELIKNDYNELEQDKQQLHNQMKIYVDNNEMKSRLYEDTTKKRLETLESTVQIQQKEIQRLLDTLTTKDQECKFLRTHLSQKGEEINCQQLKIESLQKDFNDMERRSIEEKEQLKIKLDKQHDMVVEHLQQAHANQMGMLTKYNQKQV